MQIKENILLAPYTTFKIGGPARYFCIVTDQFDALEAYEFAKKNNLQTFVLGGGSNILISDKGFNGLVIKVENKGIEIASQDDNQVILKVASGEVWDEVVKFAVSNNWWGIENLSHIPGSTGAIAVQNVGAYGQEAKNVIDSVVVFNKETHQIQNLNSAECGFAYRSSIFNSSEKGKYIIFYINFRLTKNINPILTYRDLQSKFAGKTRSLIDIRTAVTEIRDSKFPFPTEAIKGNAGSFFKNPVLDDQAYSKLKELIEVNFGNAKALELEKKKFVDDTIYAAAQIVSVVENKIKVPAAFLLELCGLKGLAFGGASINVNQPLVIINQTGTATSEDVLNLANQVRELVFEKTGITLQFEPEFIGF